MQEKKPRRSRPARKSRKTLFIKLALLAISIPAIVVGYYLIRYYYIFDRIIEEKLGRRYEVNQAEIYAAPTVLSPGRQFSLEEVAARLRRLGYEESAADAEPGAGQYSIPGEGRLIVRNGPGLILDSGRSAELAFAKARLRTIADRATGESLQGFHLKPELLSNVITKSREKRRFVPYGDYPEVLVKAVLASEDRRFFSHAGVDPIRIIKALYIDIRAGDKVQGASTLTQQFVKNYFLTQERTWKRKLTDAYMAILLEQRFSKEEIFELYANEVYLGQRGSFGIVGLGEASEAFFHKNVKELTLGESAMIAGIISAPNRFAPLRYPERAVARRNIVLDQMAEFGMIAERERDEARALPLELKPSSVINYSDAPYFVDFVQDVLDERFPDLEMTRSRYTVHTTLDMDLQRVAYESLLEGMKELDDQLAKGKRAIEPGTVQASLIAVDPRDGRILAMIGGRNYGVSQFNRITQSRRQPGSIFKPFVYAAALETAYTSPTPLTAASTVLDAPAQFEFDNLLYEPRNFREEYSGQVTMRQAMARSMNIATIKIAEQVGYRRIAELALRLGLNEQIKPYPAMAIGAFEVTPLEMVRAYTAFANQGSLTQLRPITWILDPAGASVFESAPESAEALTPAVAFMITSLLQSVVNEGTGAGIRSRGFTLPAAGKTGTSHDGWFAGYTPDLLCIVWVGFDDNRELNLSGSQSALPIWASFMNKAVALKPLTGEPFLPPEDVPEAEIDPTTGHLAGPSCLYHAREYFIKGTEPVIACYGNNYAHSGGGYPLSIYSTPKESPLDADKASAPPEPKKKQTR